MVAAVVWGTALLYLLVTFCYAATRIRYSRVRAAGPLRPAVLPGDLDPYTLALLAGGRTRMGEVAVAELFLAGRITAWGPGMVARVPDSRQAPPAPLSAAPFVRLLAARLVSDRPLPVDRLASTAACGDAVTATLWRLRRLGLFLAPDRLRRVTALRRAAWLSQAALGVTGVLGAGFAVGWTVSSASADRSPAPLLLVLLLGYPFLLHAAYRAAGGLAGAVGAAALVVAVSAVAGRFAAELLAATALFAGWFAAYAVYRGTGGRLGPRSAAGDVLLAEARAELETCGGDGALLRATALLGFRGLRARGAPPAAPPRLVRLAAFAAACGRSFGCADRGVGGDFGWDGSCGEWARAERLPLPSAAQHGGRDRGGPSSGRP
ncbi:TIGR04222 domain-containing membrane protein [Thermobifida cellulosilytica]|uniref:TIGR04222 domain-containing membrane protein n=1 Tax=Thermobifida cellulosilytica TB100 TaxID=665004 RepID=A0A147KMM5_THECS|nr:TIGR04222 domain-containing membrane protein [Thermobifida cellulosilytica]KUP98509.1 hypothetical protein AC529_00750 [Thermobifida cellulosilytica TB100]